MHRSAMLAPDVARCALVNAPAHWPALQVLVVAHASATGASEAAQRAQARQRVRALLRQYAGADWAEALRRTPDEPQGAGPVSVSHEVGWSLLAWAPRGYVGVDAVDGARLSKMPVQEWVATAALYLGPAGLSEVRALCPWADEALLFAHAWARHESRLKCLGLALQEWSAELQTQLNTCEARAVSVPAAAGAPGRVAWLAWRDVVPSSA